MNKTLGFVCVTIDEEYRCTSQSCQVKITSKCMQFDILFKIQQYHLLYTGLNNNDSTRLYFDSSVSQIVEFVEILPQIKITMIADIIIRKDLDEQSSHDQ
jgi:hypothetical protein